MKRTFVILAIFIFLLQLQLTISQVNTKTLYKECIIYQYDYKFGEIDYTSMKTNRVCKYNDKGELTDWRSNNSNGELSGSCLYKFDNKGNKIKEVIYDNRGSIVKQNSYLYDNKFQVTTMIEYNSQGSVESKTIYIYDEKWQIKQEIEYLADGMVIICDNYKYDSKGNLSEYTQHDDCNISSHKHTIFYNEKGCEIENGIYSKDGSLESRVTIKYDEAGNRTEETEFSSLNEPVSLTRYVYNK